MRSRKLLALVFAMFVAGIQLIGCGGEPKLTITGSLPSSGTVGTAYTGSLSASGGSKSYTWNVTGLPTGVTASGTSSATLSVSGTPTAAGPFNVTATLTDTKSHTATYTAAVTISSATNPVTISGTLPATASVGTAYSGSLTASGGTSPYTWTVSGLPANVTASNTSSATVTVAGTPTSAGTSSVTATVTDSKGGTASYTVSIVVSSSAKITIADTFPSSGTVGTTYTGTYVAQGGTGSYTWTVTGLPTGVVPTNGTTSAQYSASGVPTTAGNYNFSATVTDSASNTVTVGEKIMISATGGATFTVSPTTLGSLTNGTAVTPIAITSSPAGTAPYLWTVSAGALPAGLVLSNGTSTSATAINSTTNSINITGTPTAAGAYSFTLSVQDSASPKGTGSQAFSGTVSGGSTTTACGPPASGTLALRGNESALSAPFAFILAGADANDNPVTWAGSFTPNGSGAITASDLDVVTGSLAQNYQVQLAGSSYSYGADGRGCLYLAINQVNGNAAPARAETARDALPHGKGRQSLKAASAEVLPNLGTVTFSFSISAPYETGRIEQFDYINSEIQAAGQMHQQTPSDFSLGKIGADYVLGVTGWLVNIPQQNYSRTALAANITNASGTITSPSADLNIGGTPSGQLTGGSGSFGTTVSSETGRGTGTYTIPYGGGTVTFGFDYYIINSADLYVITNDTPVADAFILSGRLLSASSSVTGLNGYYLAAYTGLDTNGSNVDAGNNSVSIGTFQAGATSIVNATVYTNDGGNYATNTYGVAPYVVQPPNSRMSIANLTEFPPIIYLTNTVTEDDIAGFVVGTDPNTSGGFILLQTTGAAPNFSASSLSGGYIFGTSEDIAGISGSNVGQYNFASGSFTGTTDVVNVTTGPNSMLPNQAISGMVNVNGDGSGNLPANSVTIVTNGGVILGVSNTSQAVQPLLYIWVAQTLVNP
jgi:putative Ig domain-containing protein